MVRIGSLMQEQKGGKVRISVEALLAALARSYRFVGSRNQP